MNELKKENGMNNENMRRRLTKLVDSVATIAAQHDPDSNIARQLRSLGKDFDSAAQYFYEVEEATDHPYLHTKDFPFWAVQEIEAWKQYTWLVYWKDNKQFFCSFVPEEIPSMLHASGEYHIKKLTYSDLVSFIVNQDDTLVTIKNGDFVVYADSASPCQE